MPDASIVLPVMIKEPWQRHMTEACVKILRATTTRPFQLIIVETESQECDDLADTYLHRPEKTTYVQDVNAGIDAATGDFIVHTGNDIYTKPGWLEALFECFKRPDCGIASLGVQEVGAMLAHRPAPFIVEGWYGPFMMFRKGWRLDEAFESMASDNDLIMRVYDAGLRAYRNHAVCVLHLNNQTWNGAGNPQEAAMIQQRALQTFAERWGKHPSWAATMILRGGVAFGREFERFAVSGVPQG